MLYNPKKIEALKLLSANSEEESDVTAQKTDQNQKMKLLR